MARTKSVEAMVTGRTVSVRPSLEDGVTGQQANNRDAGKPEKAGHRGFVRQGKGTSILQRETNK